MSTVKEPMRNLPNSIHTATDIRMGNAYKQGYRAHLKRSQRRPKSRRSVCRMDSRTFSVGSGVLCNSSNNHMNEWTVETLASFPGRSHLQYLILYSMQIWRWKAWEIWLLAVTSGSQKIDTWGAVPSEEPQSPFLYMYYWSEDWRTQENCW